MNLVEYDRKAPKIEDNVFIAPTAVIVGDVEIKAGASIWFGVVLRGDLDPIRIGRNANIQDNCTVHTDVGCPVIIGDRVSIGHNAVLHGCHVENDCLIGIGAVLLNAARVRTGSIVAAGSVVTEGLEVGPHQLVAGAPAKLKKHLDRAANDIIQKPLNDYLEFSKQYRKILR
jgi:carbonic anhydrase/acetyltransferase-like protein (isoleucine patch superfamily)